MLKAVIENRIKKPLQPDQGGMALVLTLLAVSFMVAVTVQLLSSVNWQMQASVNLRDSVMLDAMNRSGLSIARAALLADQRENKFDSAHDSWNTLGEDNLGSLLGQGMLTVEVTDLSGRLQVNALVSTEKDPKKKMDQEKIQKGLWLRFLTSGRFAVEDDDEALTLLDAIYDWIDENDEEISDKGAESGYYQGLSPPYATRNGPIQYPEELLLIRGMTPAIFYGNEDYSGIADFVTVVGREGKVNINSAPAEVLLALADGIDEEMVQKAIEFRSNEENRDSLAATAWLNQFVFGGITLDQNLLTTSSSNFQVMATAQNNGLTRIGKGVLERKDNETQVLLSWEVR